MKCRIIFLSLLILLFFFINNHPIDGLISSLKASKCSCLYSSINLNNDKSKKEKKIRVDELLVNKGLANDLSHAKALIMSRLILDKDGNYINSHAILVKEDAEVRHKINKHKRTGNYVSRAGMKLSHAIETLNLQNYIKNSICLDIGASTGGFTDVLLQNDASIVYAVDVGVSLLDWKIRSDNRVRVIEKMNARYLNASVIEDHGNIDVVVCDVSFISLKSIIPPSLLMCKTNAHLICLIKPQFECDKTEISEGGVVTDATVREKVVNDIVQWFETMYKNIWHILDVIESPIKGTSGNIEYLLIAKKDT